jgi:hypothetical protein
MGVRASWITASIVMARSSDARSGPPAMTINRLVGPPEFRLRSAFAGPAARAMTTFVKSVALVR